MKIAFIKYAGMASGGVEKYLQTIACALPKHTFEVDFYYTNVSPVTLNSEFVHPDNDDSRIEICQENGVNLIAVNVDEKEGGKEPYTWVKTDFWDKFDESKYDLIVTGRGGYTEYPFTEINNTPILDTIHSFTGEDKPNIYKAILLCDWQFEKWKNSGGNENKAVIIPSLVKIPKMDESLGDMREKLGIPKDAFVYGFHQGNREDIFSPVSLWAYERMSYEDCYFIIMGGAEKHKVLGRSIEKNIKFVDFSSDPLDIHRFLNTLDVFTHARADGEVCSAAIIEALSHGLPIISHPALNMGHVEQVNECGFIANTIERYRAAMELFKEDNVLRSGFSENAIAKYKDRYEYTLVMNKILEVFYKAKADLCS